VGDPCATDGYRSSCQPAENCDSLPQFIKSGRLQPEAVVNCGFTTRGEKICCPVEQAAVIPTSIPPITITTTTTTTENQHWLSIFSTDREYLARSVAQTIRPNRDSIVFPQSDNYSGASCHTPLYEGKCLPLSKCDSVGTLLRQRRLQDEDIQTCRGGTTEEIICCPTNLPLQPRSEWNNPVQLKTSTRVGLPLPQRTTTAPTTTALTDEQLLAVAQLLLPNYTHLAGLAYLNAAADGHVHRCTALVLMPQLLLSAAACGRPSHAIFGVADLLDADVEEDYLVEVTQVLLYRQDLALLRLQKPLLLGPESTAQVSVASFCSQFEVTRLQVSGQIVASAWALGNGSDCALYELPMRLLPQSACQELPNLGGVQDLPAKHICLTPRDPNALLASNSSSACAPCPAVVGSVLHLLRPNGSRCVMGVATPTGAKCSDEVMYFTTVLDSQLVEFVEHHKK
ncbi:CG15046, partial [Drosophila busckii]